METQSEISETPLTVKRVLSIDIGIKNLAYCITDFFSEGHNFELIHTDKVCIGEVKHTCQKLCVSLIDFFDNEEIINNKNIDHVLIENQISRSIKNTTLGYSCYSYFYTKSLYSENEMNVQFISPRDKFKAVENYFPGILENYETDSTKAKSADLKKLSILICKDLCTEYNIEKGLEALKVYKKKDDLSDVLLQSFAFDMTKYSNSGNPVRIKRRRR